MQQYHAIRIDPTPSEVVALLSAATAAANGFHEMRLLEDDDAKWRKFTRTLEKSAAGCKDFVAGRGRLPTSQVVGSWWTTSAASTSSFAVVASKTNRQTI